MSSSPCVVSDVPGYTRQLEFVTRAKYDALARELEEARTSREAIWSALRAVLDNPHAYTDALRDRDVYREEMERAQVSGKAELYTL